jgi:hypothetical protein
MVKRISKLTNRLKYFKATKNLLQVIAYILQQHKTHFRFCIIKLHFNAKKLRKIKNKHTTNCKTKLLPPLFLLSPIAVIQ